MRINLDSPVIEFVSTVADYMLLNVLFLLTCLPVITIGPSVSALYAVMMKEVRHENTEILKMYLRAFKSSFRVSFGLSLIYTGLGVIIGFSLLFWWKQRLFSYISMVSIVFMSVGSLIYVFSLLYVFALSARFENDIIETVKNAFILAICNLKETLLLCFILIAVSVLIFYIKISFLWIGFIGCSAVAYIQSKLYVVVFSKYETRKE